MSRREFTGKTRKAALKRSNMRCEAVVRGRVSYDPITGIFTCIKTYGPNGVGARVGGMKPDGYRTICIAGEVYQEHHLAWWFQTGHWPQQQIDHINGVRFENLREVSAAENCRNKSRMGNNSSGVNGVCFHKRDGDWRAYIKTNDGNVHLGYFPTLEQAVAARKAAEQQHGYHANHGRQSHG